MEFQPVEFLTEPDVKALRHDGSYERVLKILAAANEALKAGTQVRVEVAGFTTGPDTQDWNITFVYPNGERQTVDPWVWAVSPSANVLEAMEDAKYRNKYTLPEEAE